VHRLQRLDEFAGGQGLGQVSVGSLAQRAVDEFGVEVPGVDHHAAGARVGHEDGDLGLVGLGLGERVVQHDVHDVLDSLVRVDLHDAHAVAISLEHAGHPEEHDVVVVDQRHRNHRVTVPAVPSPHIPP